MATKNIKHTVGGFVFEGEMPLCEGEKSIQHRYFIAFEREMLRILCVSASPTPDGIRFLFEMARLFKVPDAALLLGVVPETLTHWEGATLEARAEAWERLVSMTEDLLAGRKTTIERLHADFVGHPPKSWLTPEQLQARQVLRKGAKTHHVIPVQELADADRAAKEVAAQPQPVG